jgi:hypothetical protein
MIIDEGRQQQPSSSGYQQVMQKLAQTLSTG